MRKKLIALFASMCMIISMLPITALAAGEDAPGKLYVGQTQITGSGYWKTTAEGKLEHGSESDYNVYYDGNGTLTLKDAIIHGSGNSSLSQSENYGIYVKNASDQSVSLTINLIGRNTVSGCEGICIYAKTADNVTLIIQSDDSKGSLEANGSVSDGISVSASGGNTSLIINNASVEARGENRGVNIESFIARNPIPSLTVNGGSLTAQGKYGIAYFSIDGINPSTSMTVSDSALIKAIPNIYAFGTSKPTPQTNGESGGIVFDGNNGTPCTARWNCGRIWRLVRTKS